MSFDEITGQDTAKKIIKNDIISGRIASSYLFMGPKGVGKKLVAINFAKALNCQGKKERPCEECINCKFIEKGNFPDLILISPGEKGSIKIDTVRELRQAISFRTKAKRFIIIEDAEALTEQAQNAFLKTLEEPPLDTTIILTTSNPNYLFQTIISRCKIVKFRKLKREEVESLLKVKGAKDYKLLANLSGGSMEKVESLLESNIRRDAVKFAYSPLKKRLSLIGMLKDIPMEDFLNSLYVLYGDMLAQHFGLQVRNVDIDLVDNQPHFSLSGMKVIRRSQIALKYNVIVENILYYLSYELPELG